MSSFITFESFEVKDATAAARFLLGLCFAPVLPFDFFCRSSGAGAGVASGRRRGRGGCMDNGGRRRGFGAGFALVGMIYKGWDGIHVGDVVRGSCRAGKCSFYECHDFNELLLPSVARRFSLWGVGAVHPSEFFVGGPARAVAISQDWVDTTRSVPKVGLQSIVVFGGGVLHTSMHKPVPIL